MVNEQVYAFKMVTGEEMMARIVSEDDHTYTLDHPVTLVASQEGLTLTPAVFIGNLDKPVELRKSAVIIKSEAKDEIAGKYIEAVTGISVPSKRIIMG